MSRPTDMLLSIVYSSNATAPFDDVALADLLAHSRSNNARDGLTGMLLYRDGRFLQVLEGPEEAVRERMRTIADDDRHGSVRTLLEEEISDRQFPEWTMGYETDAAATAAPGYRAAFTDLESDHGDDSRVIRALRELTGWFRARTGHSG